MKIHYVVGFLFDKRCENVLLIRKSKPEWQRGLLNGIGGKVELEEQTETSMIREFNEETTNTKTLTWRRYCIMSGKNNDGSEFCVDVFSARTDVIDDIKSKESEVVELHPTQKICGGQEKMIGNVPWLVSMAIDFEQGSYPPKAILAYY